MTVNTDRPHVEERGELALPLDGQDMILRPSYEAIDAFEKATGKGLLQLARESLNGSLTLAETAQIACECIRAWGRANEDRGSAGANTQRIAELIMESDGGLRLALSTISAMLALAVTGNYTAKGEVKPVTTKKTEQAPVAG